MRIGIAHQFNQGTGKLVEERFVRTQLVTVAGCTADDPAQHKATAFVRRHHAIGNQEGTGADVVGHDTQGGLGGRGTTQNVGSGFQQILEQVDFIVAVNALQHRCNSLQTHTGIHRRLGQVQHLAISCAVVLHEHHVPDLDVAVAVFLRATGRAASHVRAVVIEDFGAGAAGAGVTHLPEVVGGVARTLVVANADNAVCWNANFFVPDIKGFVVFGVNRYPQLFLGQVQVLLTGQEGPGKVNGLALEVIAEAEVAQHFEEGMVAGGITHVLQVVMLAAGAHTLLGRCCPVIVALFTAKEGILELVHASVGEQQCRVVCRYQGTARHNGVTLLFEIFQKRLSQLCGFHRPLIPLK